MDTIAPVTADLFGQVHKGLDVLLKPTQTPVSSRPGHHVLEATTHVFEILVDVVIAATSSVLVTHLLDGLLTDQVDCDLGPKPISRIILFHIVTRISCIDQGKFSAFGFVITTAMMNALVSPAVAVINLNVDIIFMYSTVRFASGTS